MESRKPRALEVVEISTGKVELEVDVTGKSESQIERIERGMLINLDQEHFLMRDTGAE